MAIINVTPDSFAEGGRFRDAAAAIEGACQAIEAGAHIVDVGGESTRPGAVPVAVDEELRRVIPVIAGIRRAHATIPISVDTTKARVAHQAIVAGATMVNDVSAGRFDPAMLSVVAEHRVEYVLMHMHGTPATMQQAPSYADVVVEVMAFLRARLATAEHAGIPRARCFIDPGIGFGKTPEHNLALLRALPQLAADAVPVVLGVSRKSIVGHLLGGAPVHERLEGSLSLAAVAAQAGVTVLRVHDVAATRRFLQVWEGVRYRIPSGVKHFTPEGIRYLTPLPSTPNPTT